MQSHVAAKPLEELIHELPPPLRLEVRNFIEFLLTKRQLPIQRKLRQDWAGSVQSCEHSSVDLQHLALTWRDT